jgi:hypothetical protein
VPSSRRKNREKLDAVAGFDATAIHAASQSFVRASRGQDRRVEGGGDMRFIVHSHEYSDWKVVWRFHRPGNDCSSHPPDYDDRCVMSGPKWETSVSLDHVGNVTLLWFAGSEERFEEDMIMAKLLA